MYAGAMNDQNLGLFLKKVFYATWVILGVASLVYMAFLARQPLLWIAIAAFLAVAINPLVHKVQRIMPKKSLALATIVMLTVLCGAIGLLMWLFLAPLLQQTTSLISNLPEIVGKVNEALSRTPLSKSLGSTQQQVIASLQNNSSQLLSSFSQVASLLIDILSSAIGAVVAFVSVISLMFFMTLEGSQIKDFALRLAPKKSRKQLSDVGSDVYGIINGYVVGNFIISAIYGAASALILWALGSPYFLVLALVVGLIDLIPLVGATIGAVLVGFIFLLSGQPLAAVAFAVYTIIYVQFESSVLNPAIYSKNVDVSPLTVLASILIGGAVAGIMGALVAIPVAATLKVVVNALLANRSEVA